MRGAGRLRIKISARELAAFEQSTRCRIDRPLLRQQADQWSRHLAAVQLQSARALPHTLHWACRRHQHAHRRVADAQAAIDEIAVAWAAPGRARIERIGVLHTLRRIEQSSGELAIGAGYL